jgi:hypothetical protein
MISSRLYYASMMLFWVCYLTLLALVVIYAPQGGVALAGFTLFSDTGLITTALEAMQAIGLSAFGQSVMLRPSRRFQRLPAPDCMLFAMLFNVFGEEREQREARPLAQGPVACVRRSRGCLSVVIFIRRRGGGASAGACSSARLAVCALTVVSLGAATHRTRRASKAT